MRTKNLIVTTVVCVFSLMGGYAQRIEAGVSSGGPVINCSDMHSNSRTALKKGNSELFLSNEAANQDVYYRFAVNNSDIGPTEGSNWELGFEQCVYNLGSEWRLPTHRELMIIWMLRDQLETKVGFTPFANRIYMSGTAYHPTPDYYAWAVSFIRTPGSGLTTPGGSVTTIGQSSKYYVRCIKEL